MDVFVSYSSKDRNRVRPIVAALENRGYSVWWDTRIEIGTSFDKKIEVELDDASCVVVVWSKHSIESEWVLNEASEGLNRGILVPVRIDDSRVPLAFRRLQTADMSSASPGALEQAIEGISRVLGESSSPARAHGSPDAHIRRASRSMIIAGAALALIVAIVVWLNIFVVNRESIFESGSAKRVAVLPFRDLSPGGGLQWLADGLQIRLTQIIGSSENHQVIPTPLASRMIEDGSMEQIDLLISATLQQEGDSIRTTVELTELGTKQQLWSQTFIGGDNDLFEYQQNMALQVARYFATTVEDDAVPTEPTAWNPYLKYLHYQWGGAFDQEVYWLQKTLESDPQWSTGWEALMTQLIRRAVILKEDHWIEKAKQAAEKACETSSIEHTNCRFSMAEYAMWIDGDFGKTERIYHSLVVDEGWLLPYALLMLHSGMPVEAAELFEKVTEAIPLFPIAWDWLSVARGISGDLLGSLEAANEFGRLIPGDAVVPDLGRGVIAAKLGMTEQAMELAQRLEEASRDAEEGSDFERFARFGSDLIEAKVQTVAEDYIRAAEIAEQLASIDALNFAAAVYLEIGDDRAKGLLQEAAARPWFQRRGISLFLLYLDRDLHGHPEVKEYLNALGQTQEWQEELCRRIRDHGTSLATKCVRR